MNLATTVKDERGMATSLLETVIVIAIIAVLSSVALVSAMGHLEDARISRAVADAEMIGVSIHSFMNDTGFAPAFRNGTAHGPADAVFTVLETAGNDPEVAASLHWPMETAGHDRLENQLVKNLPAGTGTPYLRMGQVSYARFKGWNGPYTVKMPASDPWDDKYFVNVQLLTPKGVQDENETLAVGIGQRAAVFVISAGPNRQLETRFDQVADAFVTGGDDIVFRVQ